MSAAVIPSVSIEALIAARDGVVASFESSRSAMLEARERASAFGASVPELLVGFAGDHQRDLCDERYREAILNEIDRHFWLALFRQTNVDTLMPSAKRRDLWSRLHKSRAFSGDQADALPPLTRENIAATFGDLAESQAELFEECVESAYQSLSWDHKTNEPGKLGRKLIVNGAFYFWSKSLEGDSTRLGDHEGLHDLERALLVLAKREPATHGNGLRGLDSLRWGTWYDAPAPDGGDPVLRVKVFKKGTAHVEILDDALVDGLNRIMARRYPGALSDPTRSRSAPAAAGARDVDEYRDRQEFYTPEPLAKHVVGVALEGYMRKGDVRMLEPSAGAGALVREALRAGVEDVSAIDGARDALEALESLSNAVARRGGDAVVRVRSADFLREPIPDGPYRFDVVAMNPPFADGRAALHVLHALEFVARGGRLVAIMPASAATRRDGPYAMLHDLATIHDAEFRSLPSGSFRAAGTDVEVVLLVLDVPG